MDRRISLSRLLSQLDHLSCIHHLHLPFLILVAPFIHTATLEDACDGIRNYIGVWEVAILREEGEVWPVTASPIVFAI